MRAACPRLSASAETLPLICAYAARQDWDGIFLFDYNSDRYRSVVEGLYEKAKFRWAARKKLQAKAKAKGMKVP